MPCTSGPARDEKGAALVVALMAMTLLTALGAGLTFVTGVDARIAANLRAGVEARYAAASIAEFVTAHLAGVANWDDVLTGSVRSSFVDGLPAGERVLAGGVRVDLERVVNVARCGKFAACTLADMNVSTSRRPWGLNNARWQLYAYGPYGALLGLSTPAAPSMYVVALVGDDGLETDADPLRDGGGSGNPGAGVLLVRAAAFSASGAQAVFEATVARFDDGRVRRLTGRQLQAHLSLAASLTPYRG